VFIAVERQRHLTEREAWIDAAQRAAQDPLTGLANRSLFLDHLDRARLLGDRYDRTTGLLFIDVDDLKVVNDTHGHAAGDRVILDRCRERPATRRTRRPTTPAGPAARQLTQRVTAAARGPPDAFATQ
jgi:predicted signal transduction protein with EAL and GGDEF domain